MALDLPVVGSTAGPDWATKLNAAITTVDAHDHTTGKGVQIPAGGIAANAVTTAKIQDGAVTAAKLGAPVLQLVELKTPTSGSSVTFTGLDGENVAYYAIEWRIRTTGGTQIITLKPNGVTTNQKGSRDVQGTLVTGLTTFELANNGAGFSYAHGRSIFFPKTGANRAFRSEGTTRKADGTTPETDIRNSGFWTDTATALTSLEIALDAGTFHASGGTEIALLKMPRS